MKKEKIVSALAVIYFMVGFAVAIVFVLYYRWSYLSFLSPGFYSVILSWPYQLIGFVRDFWTYGLAGKPI